MTNTTHLMASVSRLAFALLDKKIDAVLRNPNSDDALRELVDCLPQESRDTLTSIMQSVLSDKESN